MQGKNMDNSRKQDLKNIIHDWLNPMDKDEKF